VDASGRNLELARRWLDPRVHLVLGRFDPTDPFGIEPRPDLLVVPLSFDGDRTLVYRRPPARLVLVHDWIWSRRSGGVIVSPLLLKKLVLVR
jgi:hypothetical protein